AAPEAVVGVELTGFDFVRGGLLRRGRGSARLGGAGGGGLVTGSEGCAGADRGGRREEVAAGAGCAVILVRAVFLAHGSSVPSSVGRSARSISGGGMHVTCRHGRVPVWRTIDPSRGRLRPGMTVVGVS